MDRPEPNALSTEISLEIEQPPNPSASSRLCFRLSIIISVLWGAALLAFFIYFLSDPSFKMQLIEFSRKHGSRSFLNIALMIIAETLVLMMGISASVPEVCYIFFLRSYWRAFLIAAISRQLATVLCYFIGRKLIHNSMRDYMNSLEICKTIETMLAVKPFTTMLLVRLSMMPNFVKYYGLPIMNPRLWKLNTVVFITTAFQSHLYLLPGYLAREESEITTGHFHSRFSNIAIYACGGFYLMVFVLLGWLIRREMRKIQESSLQVKNESTQSSITL